jgi:hypothetical protein
LPHAPQFSASVCVFTQPLAHAVGVLPVHVQLLDTHVRPPVHVMPHPPQLFGSVARLRHTPPQLFVPVAQHTPD